MYEEEEIVVRSRRNLQGYRKPKPDFRDKRYLFTTPGRFVSFVFMKL